MPELRTAALEKTRKCDVILNTSAERRAPPLLGLVIGD